jgi:hypothetical protein
MTELFSSPAFWGSLATLTFLEIVLGIDNLLFVSIATGKLQGEQKQDGDAHRRLGRDGAADRHAGPDLLDPAARQVAPVPPAACAWRSLWRMAART